jgi:phosphoenolpyruvate carboxykinase (ATP)
MVNFGTRHEVLIAGTRYAGEIKKSIFSVLNHLLPGRRRLSHALLGERRGATVTSRSSSASPARARRRFRPMPRRVGSSATTSTDGARTASSTSRGAATPRRSGSHRDGEPEIYQATQMFGTILENVVLDERTRAIDFDDGSITENTRASYPIHYIS